MEKAFVKNLDKPNEYTQAFTAQTSVTVTHNLGYKPDVWVEDSSGNALTPDIQHTSSNAFTVTFGTSQTGTIHYQ